MTTINKNQAFTLVELSIVLVILGLLVGGVLSGQSLIRSAELRAITTEYNRYNTAVQAFRDKYFAIPGDMTNATSFWGKSATYCNSDPATAGSPGTCNGNGDGMVGKGANSATGEMFQFWNQLALAGLIEGTYTGASGPTNGGAPGQDVIPGTNSPKSKAANSGWGVFNTQAAYGTPAMYPGDGGAYAFQYGNMYDFGARINGSEPLGPSLKPEEAWNLDTKIDDGKPGAGKIVAHYWNNACATATSNTDYASNYNLSNSTAQCSLHFAQVF